MLDLTALESRTDPQRLGGRLGQVAYGAPVRRVRGEQEQPGGHPGAG